MVNHSPKSFPSEHSFDSQHVVLSQTLVKSVWERFCHIFSSLWEELMKKISPLLTCKILCFCQDMFLSLLATSILFEIVRTWRSRYKCNYLDNPKLFLNFLFHFGSIHEFLNILKKYMIVIANLLPKLQTVKDFVRPLSKNLCLRRSFDSQYFKEYQTLVRSTWEHYCHIFSSPLEELIMKIFPLWICKILGVFANTLTAYNKSPVRDCENLLLSIQMQLS